MKTNEPIKIDWEKVKNLMSAGMGAPSIAKQLKLSDQTLYRRCKDDLGIEFVELKAKMMEIGSELLVAKGYEMAINGDRTMLIFYLKNRSGFADHVKVDGDMPESMVASYKKAIEASNKAAGKLLDKKKGRKQ